MRRLIHGRKYDSGINLLLDDYPGAAYAYSFRKLFKNYNGPCVKVRRSSDNATSDIFFVDDLLDEFSLTSFVGSGNNGFVERWYNQVYGQDDLVNLELSEQPLIVSSGNVLKINGRPRINLNNRNLTTESNGNLFTSISIDAGSKISMFFIMRPRSTGGNMLQSFGGTGWSYFTQNAAMTTIGFRNNSTLTATINASFPLEEQNLITVVKPNDSDVSVYKNNIFQGTQPMNGSWVDTRRFTFGRRPVLSTTKTHYDIQEFISYPFGQSLSSEINENILIHYGL